MYLYCKDLIVLVYLCLPLLLHHYCCTSFLVVHRIATVYRRSTHSIVLPTGEEWCDVRVRISVELLFKCMCFFQLIILHPHLHFTCHVRKKCAKSSAFYTLENPQICRSAFYQRPIQGCRLLNNSPIWQLAD